MNSIIECTGISKSFSRRTIPLVRLQDRILKMGRAGEQVTIHAVRPMDLHVQKGEWLGLYGHNGSGKTTLLKMLAGLLQPDAGSIRVHGTMSTFFDLGIGFHPERAAEENVYLHGLLHGLNPAEIKRMTEDILKFADIGQAADLPFKCYSSGMKLRLAFAASAHVDADVYLFDEILAVGDADFQQKCRAFIRGLREKNKTVILVGHDLPVLQQLSDKILLMDHGTMTWLEREPVPDRVPQTHGGR